MCLHLCIIPLVMCPGMWIGWPPKSWPVVRCRDACLFDRRHHWHMLDGILAAHVHSSIVLDDFEDSTTIREHG